MQFRNISLVLITSLLIAGLCLYFLPTNRKYSTETDINADRIITFRTLSDTANWKRWDTSYMHGRELVDIIAANGNELHYITRLDDRSTVEGSVSILKSNQWSTKLLWTEKVEFTKNIVKKLRLLFRPSEFKESFLLSIANFKQVIETPGNYLAGIEFEKVEIPDNKFVVISDTVALPAVNAVIYRLRDRIVDAIPKKNIKDHELFYSQHELLSDSTVYIRVGVIVHDNVITVPEPFDLLDMDNYPAIVMQVNRSYSEISQDVFVMHQWLKKNSYRPAFDFWVEHHMTDDLSLSNAPVTVIQEYYSVK